MDSTALVGIFSIIIAMSAAYFTYKQSQLALKQYTLDYIEMENNDKELQEAIIWLSDINNDPDYIESFHSTKAFLEFKKLPNADTYQESRFPNQELCDEYIKGRAFLNKVIATRLVASEAVISGMLDEETYWLIRHIDFSKNYSKLKKLIQADYEFHDNSDAYARKAFKMVIKKWSLVPPLRKRDYCLYKER